MLDHKTDALLDKINLHCQNSGYKVFLIEDLLSFMPSAFELDENALLDCIETLKNHQYISVKYQDDIEICLMPLIKGKIESENRIDQEIEKMKSQKQYFLASFLGAIAGGVIIGIIFIIILAIGGV